MCCGVSFDFVLRQSISEIPGHDSSERPGDYGARSSEAATVKISQGSSQ